MVLVFDRQQRQRDRGATGAVFAGDVVSKLAGADLGEEVAVVVKGLGVEELRFDVGVDAFDIRIGVRAGGGLKRCLAP